MSKRLLIVAALVLLVGLCTRAFAQEAPLADPRTPITRAGAVALILNADPDSMKRVEWHAAHMPPMPLFDDVDQRQWYAPYVEVAFEQGIITGNDERLFRPNRYLTEEEAIALATRFKASREPSDTVYLVIPSADSNWLNQIVSEAQTNGIAIKFPVQPGTIIPRSELFTMLQSAGVNQPEGIAVRMIVVTTQLPDDVYVASVPPPAPQMIAAPPAPAAAQNVAPSTAYRAPAAPRVQAQVQQQVQPATTIPYLSSKSFAVTMPSLGIKDLTIVHPSDFSHDGLLAPLKYGVGHLFSYPGQGGKILVYGHSSGYPWDVSKFTKVFRQINKLSVGDKVYVTYKGKLHTYQVTSKQTVDANDMSAYAQGGNEELILYTCWPPDSIKQRYLVHAVPVGTTVAQQ